MDAEAYGDGGSVWKKYKQVEGLGNLCRIWALGPGLGPPCVPNDQCTDR
jgi:hypothetical protein